MPGKIIKLLLSTFLLLLFSGHSFAQSEEEDIFFYLEKQNDTVGEYVHSHNPLIASRFSLSEMVYGYRLMPEKRLLFLQLRKLSRDEFYRNRGYIMVFDLEAGLGRWIRKIDYTRSTMALSEEHIIKRRRFDAYDFTPKYGKIRWHLKNALAFLDFQNGLGLERKGNKLQAIDLLDQRILWKRRVPESDESGQLFPWNDNSVLLYSGGFYKMRLTDGKGWELKQKMKFPQLPEDFFVFSSEKNLLPKKDLQAMVRDDSLFFFVTGRELVAVSDRGKLHWKKSFPKGKTGYVFSILKKGDSVTVINFYDRRNTKSSAPFIAIYRESTGDEIFFKSFAPEEKLLDVDWRGDTLYCLFDDKVAGYILSQEDESFSSQLPVYEDNKPVSFTDNATYRLTGSAWQKQSGNSLLKVLFENAKVWVLDTRLNPLEEQDNIALRLRSNELMDLLLYKDSYFLLNKDAQAIAQVNLLFPAELLGNKLILMRQSFLYIMEVYVGDKP